MELSDIKTKKHAGKYGAFEGKTANELFRDYKKWCKDNNVKAMKFSEFLEWGKARGLIKQELNANAAVSEADKEEIKESINEAAEDNIKDVRRKFGIILSVGIGIAIIIGVANSMSTPTQQTV